MAGCLALGANGVGGKGDAMGGLDKLAQAIGQALSALKGGGGGSGSGGSPPGGGLPSAATVCTSSYYSESTTPNPTDPCAYYLAPSGGTGLTGSTSSQDLLNLLGHIGSSTGTLLNTLGGSNGTTNTGTGNVLTCPPGYTGTYPICAGPSGGVCPTGYTGTYPDCVGPAGGTCPTGYTGTYPICTAPLSGACPSGYTGTYPNCNGPAGGVCPTGYSGTYPICAGSAGGVCPASYTGTYPDCVGQASNSPGAACPRGYTGTYPDCVGPAGGVCPTGYTGTYPQCVGAAGGVCPDGYAGTYPSCVGPIAGSCPADYTGVYPNCVGPAGGVCPAGYTGTYPQCVGPAAGACPTGYTGNYPNCVGPVNDATANSIGNFNPFNNLPAATTSDGRTGGIQTTPTGATFATNNILGNLETSSFFGGNGIAGLVNNLVGGWCATRPWASGFIANIIPPAFFDGLCVNAGFTPGKLPPAPAAPTKPTVPTPNNTIVPRNNNVVLTQTPVQQTKPAAPIKTSTATTTPFVPGRVDIWAVPPSVPLGARATIFWNTENVNNCSETSPNGSFSQTSLSGGAATVPLTESTTYTISCLDSEHSPVTDYVTVNITD